MNDDACTRLHSRRSFLVRATLSTVAAAGLLDSAQARVRSHDGPRCNTDHERGLGSRTPAALAEPVAGLYFGDVAEGLLAWTFDDGPRAGTTPRILDHLDRLGLRAVFFVCGRSVRRCPGIVREIAARGHGLGNHTWSHPALHELSDAAIDEQLWRTQDAVDVALGHHSLLRFHRPPFGSPWYGGVRDRARQIRRVCRAIDRHRGLLALWQMELGDWRRGATEEDLLRRMRALASRRAGGALVMHDTRGVAARALSQVAGVVERSGYRTVSLEQLVRVKYGVTAHELVAWPTSLRPARAAHGSGSPPGAISVAPSGHRE